MESTKYSVKSGVAVIELTNPPLNTLGYALRLGISEGLDKAVADDKVKAIVLIGSDRAFSGGADITEFGTGGASKAPTLHDLIKQIEGSPKHVTAAISGACMGGGLELALACHNRLAKPDANVGLPEVNIGIIPGAGGTQRLPRLIGVEHALNMIVSGTILPAGMFMGSPLFDEMVGDDLLDRAIAFSNEQVKNGAPLRRVRDIKIKDPTAEPFLQYTRNTVKAMVKHLPAPLECVEAVANAVNKPIDEGLKLEAETCIQLAMTPESVSLRHIFFGEREALKIPDIPKDTPLRDIKSVAVIGAGTMGGGISMAFINAGFHVTILDANEEGLNKGMEVIKGIYAGRVKKGKYTQEKADEILSRLTPALEYDKIKDADLVIEAVFENMDLKEKIFKKLDEVMKKGAILATNTSTLDVDKIASFTKRPGDVIGMHFFSPAHIMPLLEVVRGEKTAKDVLATVMKLGKKIKKKPVVSGVCDGFIGNRMIGVYGWVAGFLVDEGASPEQVDKALENWGMAMGPFRMGDLAGNDISWLIRKEQKKAGTYKPASEIGDRLCEMGRFGQKVGKGWYRYEPGNRKALPDPEVAKLIEDYRKEKGITPRKISDQEIVERCTYALVNEGARILEEGIAMRASDVDMIYIFGYGFPPHRGGPLLEADRVGLYNIMRRMKDFAKTNEHTKDFWQPADLIKKLAAEGKGFNG